MLHSSERQRIIAAVPASFCRRSATAGVVVGVISFLLAVVGPAGLVAPPAGAADENGACTLWVSPTGSDAATGSQAAPLKSLAKLASLLGPNVVGCLRGGEYTLPLVAQGGPNPGNAPMLNLTKGGGVGSAAVIRSAPGEQATIVGRLVVAPTAANLLISDVTLDGGDTLFSEASSLTIDANNVTIDGAEITAPTRTCVATSEAASGRIITGLVVQNSYVHDCGNDQSWNQAPVSFPNQEHAFYIQSSQGAIIRNNVITNSSAKNLLLFPNADGSKVTDNVIDGGRDGVHIAGAVISGVTYRSEGNTVERNLVTQASRYPMSQSWPGASKPPAGDTLSNVVRNNCFFGTTAAKGFYDYYTVDIREGYAFTANQWVDPGYEDRSFPPDGYLISDLSSPCSGRGIRKLTVTGTTSPTSAVTGDVVRVVASAKNTTTENQVIRLDIDPDQIGAPGVAAYATITGVGCSGNVCTATVAPGASATATITYGAARPGTTVTHVHASSTGGLRDGFAFVSKGVTGTACTAAGTPGADSLGSSTATAAQRICGFEGNDTLTGGLGGDVVRGGPGSDLVYGNAGNDDLRGGDDNDAIQGGSGDDLLYGDAGTDTASYSGATAKVTVALVTTKQNTGTSTGSDTFNSIESLSGSAYGDTLTGNAAANSIAGNAGADTIKAGDGADTVQGGTGDDILAGEGGTDTVTYSGATGPVTVSLASTAKQNTGTAAGADTLTSFENLTGSSSADALTGNSGANVITGNPGNDTIKAGAGNDTIQGGTGNDTMFGEDGIDTVSYASASAPVDVVLTNTARSTGSATGVDTISVTIENLSGGPYSDILIGNSLNNVIQGNAGDDRLEGRAGNDVLDGGSGSDTCKQESGTGTLTCEVTS